MSKWKLVVGAAVLVATGVGFYATTRSGIDPALAAAPPGMPVPVSDVVKRNLPIYLDYSGRTESIRNVALQAKIAGYVSDQAVADGADVEKDALLYSIDKRDYSAALDQAKAQLQRDAAALDYASVLSQRGTELGKSGALAKDMIDQRVSGMKQAKATLDADEAAVHQAENNLSYTDIRAPFAGRVGRNRAPVGTLINGAGTTLNTIVQLDPIYVTFNPSETELAEIQHSRAGAPIHAEILLPGNASVEHQGELTFLDNTVDPATGTITARATIENKNRSLLPGQYVRVRLRVKEQPNALMVPQTAVQSSQLGKFLFVVGEGNKAEMRPVTLGPADGDKISVTHGIGTEDKIIVGNLQKIGPGAPVQPLQQQQADAAR